MSNYDLFINRLNTSTKISKEKLIENKINTFKRALNSSYNSELVRDSNNNEFQVLISKIDTMPKISRKSFSTLKENFAKSAKFKLYIQFSNVHNNIVNFFERWIYKWKLKIVCVIMLIL